MRCVIIKCEIQTMARGCMEHIAQKMGSKKIIEELLVDKKLPQQ
jgi:hypothetical protein